MKIGVMLRNVGERGGIWVYTVNLLTELIRIDKKNEYFFLYRSKDQKGQFPPSGNVQERVLPAPNKLWWDQISVPRLAKREGLDLIFNPKLTVPLVTRCKTIQVMHGAEQFAVPEVFKLSDRIYFTIANRLYCKKASAVITMTHMGASDIVQYMGADPDKVFAISESYNERCHQADEASKRLVKQKYNLPDRFILFVGGISPLKNFGNLLRAFHSLSKTDSPHKLVVVGFKRWRYSDDLRLVEQLGLRDLVVFTDFIADEDIPGIYSLAELFVFPSLYEGFGMPVLEAMACGCPVITTKTGCSPEVAGGAAVLVDPYDPEEIYKAIEEVLGSSELRRELVEKGLQRSRDFSWKKCAAETLGLFESVGGRAQVNG